MSKPTRTINRRSKQALRTIVLWRNGINPDARVINFQEEIPFRDRLSGGKYPYTLTDDEALSMNLLNGFGSRDATGLYRSKYFDKESEDEILGRSALARLLRSEKQLSPMVRNSLANLFDPTGSNERELVFRFRAEGHRSDWLVGAQIAYHVARRIQRGEKVEAAISFVMGHIGLSRRAVQEAYRRYRSVVEGIVP